MMFPRPLCPGDRVLLVSPSSPLPEDQPVDEIARRVEALGFQVEIGASCREKSASGYAAASPEIRAADLNRGFGDPRIHAVWCTRGGSTAWQLLPLLDYAVIRANPKPFIGFSDITTLHLALGQRCGLVTYHGPTANRTLGWGEEDGFSWTSLRRAVGCWRELTVENPAGEAVETLRPGRARGALVGGNLTLVASSLGTPWQINARNRILYLEDIGEAVYALEEKLYQLRYAGVFRQAAGVALGAFTDCRNSYREDYGPDELMRDFFAEYPKPVLKNIRSAHVSPMVTLPMGAMCEIDGGRRRMTFFRE